MTKLSLVPSKHLRPHESDPLFLLALELAAEIADRVPARHTGGVRYRLQTAAVKLAERLGRVAPETQTVLERRRLGEAAAACTDIMIYLAFLRAQTLIAEAEYTHMRGIADRAFETIEERLRRTVATPPLRRRTRTATPTLGDASEAVIAPAKDDAGTDDSSGRLGDEAAGAQAEAPAVTADGPPKGNEAPAVIAEVPPQGNEVQARVNGRSAHRRGSQT